MNAFAPLPTIITSNVSRRGFLGGMFSAGAFVVASRFVPQSLLAAGSVDEFRTAADKAALSPSVYLGIDPDGTVHIVTHRSEMGTGIRTSLPMIAADELDADWPASRSSRASATPATATRTPTARSRSAISSTPSARPAPRPARC
jgi:isoquinoline 1-oxidoreductase beta subunit